MSAESYANRLGRRVVLNGQRTAKLLLDDGERIGEFEPAEWDRLVFSRYSFPCGKDEPAFWKRGGQSQQLVTVRLGRVHEDQSLTRLQQPGDLSWRAPRGRVALVE